MYFFVVEISVRIYFKKLSEKVQVLNVVLPQGSFSIDFYMKKSIFPGLLFLRDFLHDITLILWAI